MKPSKIKMSLDGFNDRKKTKHRKIIDVNTFEVYRSITDCANKLGVSQPLVYGQAEIGEKLMWLNEWEILPETNKKKNNFIFFNIWEKFYEESIN